MTDSAAIPRITLSGQALHALAGADDLRVLAVFGRSLYLASGTEGGLLCLCRADLDPGPLNALCQPWPERLPPEGTPCERRGGRLVCGETAFDLSAAHLWEPPAPPPFSAETLAPALCRAKRVLADRPLPAQGLGKLLPPLLESVTEYGSSAIPAVSFSPAAPPPLRPSAPGGSAIGGSAIGGSAIGGPAPFTPPKPAPAAAQETLEELARPGLCALWQWLTGRAASPDSAVNALIGLGPGLTPSGDDVLGGVFIAMHAAGMDKAALARAAAAAGGRTNRISRAHLACAMRGAGALSLHLWLNALLSGADASALERAADGLDNVGHSSGWDAALGIVLALCARLTMAGTP